MSLETNNDLTFAGLMGLNDEELLGAIQRNPAAFKKMIAKTNGAIKVAAQTNPSPRVQMEARIDQLPVNLQNALRGKNAQLVDTHLMVVKSVSGATSIKMLKDSDTKSTGLCMINNAKLEKDEQMLLTGITLLYATGSATTESGAVVGALTFKQLENAIRSGEFEFNAGNKTIIPRTSLEVFCGVYTEETTVQASTVNVGGYAHAYGASKEIGYFRLDSPKMLESQISLELNIEWGLAATTNGYLKAILHGTRVYKY